MKQTINCKKFSGWVFICPECEGRDYVDDDDISFDPTDDMVHIIVCELCKKEFEIATELKAR